MADKIIKVTIKKDSTLTAEGQGFKGKECDSAMDFIKNLGPVKSRKNKPDYFDGGTPKINVQSTK